MGLIASLTGAMCLFIVIHGAEKAGNRILLASVTREFAHAAREVEPPSCSPSCCAMPARRGKDNWRRAAALAELLASTELTAADRAGLEALSDESQTGFKFVYVNDRSCSSSKPLHANPYCLRPGSNDRSGRKHHLAFFATAEEAALAIVRSPKGIAAIVDAAAAAAAAAPAMTAARRSPRRRRRASSCCAPRRTRRGSASSPAAAAAARTSSRT